MARRSRQTGNRVRAPRVPGSRFAASPSLPRWPWLAPLLFIRECDIRACACGIKVCGYAIWLGACGIWLSGCGYSFSGSSLPGYIDTIAIPVFENRSLDAEIADLVTRGIIDRFLEDNRLKVVRANRADCVVEGEVVSYERRVYTYTPDEEPEQYIVVVTISIVLKDRVKNKDLWSDEKLVASATYAASPSKFVEDTGGEAGPPQSEFDAKVAAVELIAQDVLARTLEQW